MSRMILDRWKRPSKTYLDGTFPSGKPSFDIFPAVTELTLAYYCPLAIYHHLHHNETAALYPYKTPGGWKAGDTFHQFIERLKTMISDGELVLDKDMQNSLPFIWSKFAELGKKLEKPDIIWNEYLKPWIGRKFAELTGINSKSKIYFEITFSCNHVRFETEDGGSRTYPLIGRVDEIDIEKKRIIERTIKSSTSPKDYQVWLLWKILCSIDKSKYPEKWKGVDFKNFELRVETPHEDYVVDKNNPSFERATHDAYAWLHDLAFDPSSVWDAYQERACNYENRKTDCGLSWMCYAQRQPFPESRNEMRRQFKKLYRALLWEKMWTRDFDHYKFATFSDDELNDRRLVCKGKTLQQSNNRKSFQVEISSPQKGPIWAKGSNNDNAFLVVVGNLTIGRRFLAKLKKKDENIFSVKPAQGRWGSPLSDETIIAPLGENFLIFEEKPTYLITQVQQDMHRLEFHGTKSRTKAESDSKIQLLECVFGTKNIRRGKT